MAFISTIVTQVVFYVAFTVWLVLTLLIEPVIIRSKGTKTAKTREDKGSGLLIYLSLFVSIIVAFQFAGANIMPLPDWVFIVGICLMMLGIFVREWAVTTLRGFFLFTVGVRQNHKVIENGPYRLVRHPAYSGSILTMIGLGLATQSAVAVLILAVVCGIAYGYRIHVEEPALVKELGGEYVQYMSRTKRLIPFVF
ncbi:MAG: isoprenylcysteine carboxylmethyltransferase family protein [Candidatus Bathyarchaeia archaeon]